MCVRKLSRVNESILMLVLRARIMVSNRVRKRGYGLTFVFNGCFKVRQ
jgi:hypothetical protein